MTLHDFEGYTFSGQTWCCKCNTFLWGLKLQGDRCRLCSEARCNACARSGGYCEVATSPTGLKSGSLAAVSHAINDEMFSAVKRKQSELVVAHDTKKRLEGDIVAGEQSVKASAIAAQARAAVEAEAAARLESHRLSLDDLGTDLANSRVEWADKERQQTQLKKRLEE